MYKGFFILLTLILLVPNLAIHNILQYGAIPNHDTIEVQLINQKAMINAIYAANNDSSDKIVIVPKKTFYMLPAIVQGLRDIVFFIQGKLVASKSVKQWPVDSKYCDFFKIKKSENITLRGGGKIDGRGHHWWILQLSTTLKHNRPHLVVFQDTNIISVHDLILKNSPNFHLLIDNCKFVDIYNVDIKVNTTAQLNLIKYFSLEGAIPMFPFNTDGIDIWGSEVHVYNVTCQNWDDVVVPKPSKLMRYGCSENMLVQDITVKLGVGMSIGSVPPNNQINCVKNITFRNVYMDHPFKGIYIKSNPGDSGSGIVSNIIYQNITMIKPIWWAIYIGPQQMKQPSGAGPGCMLYPFDPRGTCDTQPLVTFQNISLTNVSITNSLLYPVTIRCNISNPCRYFSFQNVTTDKWRIGQKQTGVVCQYATGIQKNSYPSVFCLNQESQKNKNQKIKKPMIKSELTQQKKQKIVQNGKILNLKQIKQIWDALFDAVINVPYIEEDDQMTDLDTIIQAVKKEASQ